MNNRKVWPEQNLEGNPYASKEPDTSTQDFGVFHQRSDPNRIKCLIASNMAQYSNQPSVAAFAQMVQQSTSLEEILKEVIFTINVFERKQPSIRCKESNCLYPIAKNIWETFSLVSCYCGKCKQFQDDSNGEVRYKEARFFLVPFSFAAAVAFCPFFSMYESIRGYQCCCEWRGNPDYEDILSILKNVRAQLEKQLA